MGGRALRSGATPIAGLVGAAVEGTDLRDGLDDAALDDLHRLLAERGVVVFTGQHLDDAGHAALAHRLGGARLPPEHFATRAHVGFPEIGVLTNNKGRGNGADTWHADVTWSARPPRYSVLHMQVTPDAGGDTMWASLVEAYDRLSDPMQRFCQTLTAEHRHTLSGATAVHPVVHRHPVTGRLALSVNPTWTTRIVELEANESAGLLAMLYEVILRPESVCRWTWHPGDVAIWDNHFVLHYAIHDYGDAPRTIHRIEVEGEPLLPALR